MTGGYCTLLSCNIGSCPDDAVCVLWNSSISGCAYDDRETSRTARTYCMKRCEDDGDCRDGYVCVSSLKEPYRARILETDQSLKVCTVPASISALNPPGVLPVCQSTSPPDSGLPLEADVKQSSEPNPDGSDDGSKMGNVISDTAADEPQPNLNDAAPE